MKRIKKIKILPFAKFQAFLFGLVGLLAGILYSVGGLVLDTAVTLGWAASPETPGLSEGTMLAFGALLGMPIIFAIYGFAVGILEAFLYNLFAARFGGVRRNFFN